MLTTTERTKTSNRPGRDVRCSKVYVKGQVDRSRCLPNIYLHILTRAVRLLKASVLFPSLWMDRDRCPCRTTEVVSVKNFSLERSYAQVNREVGNDGNASEY